MELKVLCLLSMFAVDCLVCAEQCGDLYSGQESRDTRERCCRCVDQNSDCNPDGPTGPYGFDCNEIDSDKFSSPACNLSPPRGTEDDEDDVLVIDTNLFDLRATENGTKCAAGLQLCCSPVPEGVLARQLAGPGRHNINFTSDVCGRPEVAAVQNFSQGITCGRRDSRVYYDHGAVEKGFTNPGEWPWVVPIYHRAENGSEEFIGAGAYIDSRVVITVAHNLQQFEEHPELLRVRLGDWNPNVKYSRADYHEGNLEEFPEIELRVECIRLHPAVDLDNSLDNNVAILRLTVDPPANPPAKPPAGVKLRGIVDPRSVVDNFHNKKEATGGLEKVTGGCSVPRLYLNTICLPRDQDQFRDYRDNCYVAAWGKDPKTRVGKNVGQRDVAIPLVSKEECEERLRPEFAKLGLPDWKLKPSELCAGGEKGVDTCEGEGGAPLVCYDKGLDQFFAVGLVNYGLGCNDEIPAIYVNLADPTVKDFVLSAYNNENFCK